MTVTFDVDGVLCDDRDPSVPYADRQPYPGVRERLAWLRARGVRVLVQTARYMGRTGNDQAAAHAAGHRELLDWLERHGIPHDGVFMGKVSSDLYVDDKAFLLSSNAGDAGWDLLLEGVESACRPTGTAATSAGTRPRSSGSCPTGTRPGAPGAGPPGATGGGRT